MRVGNALILEAILPAIPATALEKEYVAHMLDERIPIPTAEELAEERERRRKLLAELAGKLRAARGPTR